MAMLKLASRRVADAQTAFAAARAGQQFTIELLTERYKLMPGDHLGIDGKITRALRQKPAPQTGRGSSNAQTKR